MNVVFLSPHLDDAVYSCGGLMASMMRSSRMVSVWTLFAGDSQDALSDFARELHQRWKTGKEAVKARRIEDFKACTVMGVNARHFNHPDCIYRYETASGKPVINRNEDLFNPGPLVENDLIERISAELDATLPDEVEVYCPLGLGGHIDHRLTREAAERLHLPLVYYADFPYAGKPGISLDGLLPEGAAAKRTDLEEPDLERWIEGIAQYQSQLNSFWQNRQDMAAAVQSYAQTLLGSNVWTFA